MSLLNVSPGSKLPEQFNVIIEIAAHSTPVKYEVDKESGALTVDRFMGTAMHYPCNYGYIPQTISDDGDPCDVLVITPFALVPGSVIACRALGVLHMDDEGGGDAKLLAVPTEKLLPAYARIQSLDDLAPETLAQVQHFFEHYKDLEKGKWVKLKGYGSKEEAHQEILNGVAKYQAG